MLSLHFVRLKTFVYHVINIISFTTNLEFIILLKAIIVLANIDFIQIFGVVFEYMKIKELKMRQTEI